MLQTSRVDLSGSDSCQNRRIMNPALLVLPQHLGGLHPFEQALVMGLAFGPFVILAIVVYVVRRRDLAEESAEHSRGQGGAP